MARCPFDCDLDMAPGRLAGRRIYRDVSGFTQGNSLSNPNWLRLTTEKRQILESFLRPPFAIQAKSFAIGPRDLGQSRLYQQ